MRPSFAAPLAAALIAAALIASSHAARADESLLAVEVGDKAILVHKITLEADEYFAFDSAELNEAAKVALDGILAAVAPVPYPSLLVTGHADRLGAPDYNLELSLKRAEAVAAHLRTVGGLRPGALGLAAMGEAQPLVACEGVEGDALKACLAPNRRVEVVFTAFESVTRPDIVLVEELGTGRHDLVEIVGMDPAKIRRLD
jgi:OOP family OmpA-OmpF porin